MVLKIQILSIKQERDLEPMQYVFKELTAHPMYFSIKKNNSNNFVIALCSYQISRIENLEATNILYNVVTNPKIDITNIKIELLTEKWVKMF